MLSVLPPYDGLATGHPRAVAIGGHGSDHAVLASVGTTHGFAVYTCRSHPDLVRELLAIAPDVLLLEVTDEASGTVKAVPELAVIPMIGLSTVGGARARWQAFDRGFDDFAEKPFDRHWLGYRVCSFARQHRAAARSRAATRSPSEAWLHRVCVAFAAHLQLPPREVAVLVAARGWRTDEAPEVNRMCSVVERVAGLAAGGPPAAIIAAVETARNEVDPVMLDAFLAWAAAGGEAVWSSAPTSHP